MKIIIRFLIIIATTIFLLLTPLFLLLWQPQIVWQTVANTQTSQLSAIDLETITKQTLKYLLTRKDVPEVFPVAEVSHLADVANLFYFGELILLGAVVLLGGFYIFFRILGALDDFYRLLRNGAIFALFFIFVLAFLALVDFAVSFLYFHHVFFPQGNFTFSGSSILIQIFTERFFKEIIIYILLGAAALAGMIITISIYKLRNK